MPRVIRAGDRGQPAQFNFDDVATQAVACVEQARVEAEQIIAEAARAAEAIREQAQAEGLRAAAATIERDVEQRVSERLGALKPAVEKCVADFERARQDWMARWESDVIKLATSIARRAIRRELSAQPEIPLDLVREALQLAAGSARMRILMNPADIETIGGQVRNVLDGFSAAATIELIADRTISRGGCRLETEHGSVDQQFEVQLARIAEELS